MAATLFRLAHPTQGALLADSFASGTGKNGRGHIGFHKARRDHVHKDIMRSEGLGQRLAHGVESSLTRRVGRCFGRSPKKRPVRRYSPFAPRRVPPYAGRAQNITLDGPTRFVSSERCPHVIPYIIFNPKRAAATR